MAAPFSPLRYPGGKQILSRVLTHLVKLNGATGGTYIEPYAGGGGAALSLLFGEHVDRIVINDADPCIHAVWKAILTRTREFTDRVLRTPISIDEWRHQRDIYNAAKRKSCLELGFATFYLNRCNRSGIISGAGPIGGINQTGAWKIDARFNRTELVRRIERIAMYSDRIEATNLDGVELLRNLYGESPPSKPVFVYLDPPYYVKGQDLYLNYYTHSDHEKLAVFLANAPFRWALSYDNVPEIRRLYKNFFQLAFNLDYSARDYRTGKEVLILPAGASIPDGWKRTIPKKFITMNEERVAAFPTRSVQISA